MSMRTHLRAKLLTGIKVENIERMLHVKHQKRNNFTTQLFERAGISKGIRVLDVGCATGEVSHDRRIGIIEQVNNIGGIFYVTNVVNAL